MEIPFYVFLIIYFVALIVFFILSFYNLYHIQKFGFQDSPTKLMTILYFGIIFLILFFTLILLRKVDWQETFNPLDIFNNINLPL